MTIKRSKALRFKDEGKCDTTGEHTIFGQLYQQFLKKGFTEKHLKKNTTNNKFAEVKLAGEGSMDYGGPFREMLTDLYFEVQSPALPLCVKTPNHREEHGTNRDCWTLNPSSITPTHQKMFKFFGMLLGYSLRAQAAVDLNWPPILWKRLAGAELTLDDLRCLDMYAYQALINIRDLGQSTTADIFDMSIYETFTVQLSDGSQQELCYKGAEKSVTFENHLEYIELATKARLNEASKQLEWIVEGIHKVISPEIVSLFSWEEIELRTCGPSIITTEDLKAISSEGTANSRNPVVLMFWDMFENHFSQLDRRRYLKFVWGRSKLPSDSRGVEDLHQLDPMTTETDTFPIAHTCFFSCDVPKYTSLEIMVKRFKQAIEMCGEIDGDYDANDIAGEDSDRSSYGGYDSEGDSDSDESSNSDSEYGDDGGSYSSYY